MQHSTEEISYEKAMALLEECVAQLENGALSLEESLKIYERGVALSRQADALLKSGEGRLLKLTQEGALEPMETPE